jgi:hypothetical protein
MLIWVKTWRILMKLFKPKHLVVSGLQFLYVVLIGQLLTGMIWLGWHFYREGLYNTALPAHVLLDLFATVLRTTCKRGQCHQPQLPWPFLQVCAWLKCCLLKLLHFNVNCFKMLLIWELCRNILSSQHLFITNLFVTTSIMSYEISFIVATELTSLIHKVCFSCLPMVAGHQSLLHFSRTS